MAQDIMAVLYKKYSKAAEKRKIEFDLDLDLFTVLVQRRCSYCGAKTSNTLHYGKQELAYNGLDRIDSGLGYSKANVLPCCRFCNTLKSSMRPESWFDFLCSVIGYHQGQPPVSWFKYVDEERPSKAVNFWKMRKR